MNVWAISPLAFFPTGFLYFEIILRSQKSRVKKRKKFCELWNFHNTGWGNAPHKPQTTCSINAFTLAHLADGNISCPLLLSCRCRSESMMGLCHGKSWSDSPFFPPRLLPYTENLQIWRRDIRRANKQSWKVNSRRYKNVPLYPLAQWCTCM